MAQSKTEVRGIRVSRELWTKLTSVAKAKGKTRNGIIADLIADYCEKNSKVLIDKAPKL
jgi:predicted transcriptional regulator